MSVAVFVSISPSLVSQIERGVTRLHHHVHRLRLHRSLAVALRDSLTLPSMLYTSFVLAGRTTASKKHPDQHDSAPVVLCSLAASSLVFAARWTIEQRH